MLEDLQAFLLHGRRWGGELGDDERDELGEDLRREEEGEETRLSRVLRGSMPLSLSRLARKQRANAIDSSYQLQLLLFRQRQAREDAVEGLDLRRDGGRGCRHVEGKRKGGERRNRARELDSAIDRSTPEEKEE